MQGVLQEYVILLVRVLITVMMVVYSIFAFLMSHQINIMTKTVLMKDAHIISWLGYAHFVLAVLVLLLAIFAL